MKRIMILKEHHGTRYLDVSTDEKLESVALSVIKGRFGTKNDYYGYLEEPIPPKEPDFTKDQYAAMPESLKKSADQIIEQYRLTYRVYKQHQKEYDLVKHCLESNDGKLAIKILKSRSHYEDEGFEIVDVKEEYNVR